MKLDNASGEKRYDERNKKLHSEFIVVMKTQDLTPHVKENAKSLVQQKRVAGYNYIGKI